MQSGALLPRATGLVVASSSTWDAPPFTVPQQFRYWWRPAAAAPLGAALPPADGGGDGRLGPVGKADAAAAPTALLALESVSAAGGAGARAGTGEKRLRMGPVFDRGGRVAEREGAAAACEAAVLGESARRATRVTGSTGALHRNWKQHQKYSTLETD